MNDGRLCASAASGQEALALTSAWRPGERICRAVLSMLLVILTTPTLIGAETTIYFAGQPVSAPPPVVLLVCGFALLAIVPGSEPG
jgi:hypothetical protein